MQSAQDILAVFKQHFDGEPTIIRAPGRINLIGEHTDYNMGFVLPGAVDKAIWFAMRPNGTNITRFFASDIQDIHAFYVDKIEKSDKLWANYLMGIFDQFVKAGFSPQGIDCAFGGNLPIGSGMSSSAAMECGMAFGLNHLFGFGYERPALAKLAQSSSHQFIGVPCGIMDQFASLMGKEDQLIKLDCRSLEYQYIPAALGDFQLVLINTKVHHELGSTEYPVRVAECREGLAILQKHYPEVASLRDATPEMVEAHKDEMSDKVYRRCRFSTTENARLLRTCELLESGDIDSIGELLFQTHWGLSKDYEVSCPELDFLVEYAEKHASVSGARVMGGGFGGCTINLVKTDQTEAFLSDALAAYKKAFNIDGEAYLVDLRNGVEVVS